MRASLSALLLLPRAPDAASAQTGNAQSDHVNLVPPPAMPAIH